jgi:hypothetical protein
MSELCISLVCMNGSCVNFHNFSIGPVNIKFGECCYFTSMILGKI